MLLEKAQHTVTADVTCVFGLLPRLRAAFRSMRRHADPSVSR